MRVGQRGQRHAGQHAGVAEALLRLADAAAPRRPAAAPPAAPRAAAARRARRAAARRGSPPAACRSASQAAATASVPRRRPARPATAWRARGRRQRGGQHQHLHPGRARPTAPPPPPPAAGGVLPARARAPNAAMVAVLDTKPPKKPEPRSAEPRRRAGAAPRGRPPAARGSAAPAPPAARARMPPSQASGVVGHQRQQHQRQAGEHQAVVQFALAQPLRREAVQLRARGQQHGQHACRRPRPAPAQRTDSTPTRKVANSASSVVRPGSRERLRA